MFIQCSYCDELGFKERTKAKRYLTRFCNIACDSLFQLSDKNKEHIKKAMTKAEDPTTIEV